MFNRKNTAPKRPRKDLEQGWLRELGFIYSRASVSLLTLVLLLSLLMAGSVSAANIGLREVGTGSTEIYAEEGDVVSLELFVDTEGLTFEGYMIGVDITGGEVLGVSVAHQSLTGLFPDLFGPAVVDAPAGTIRSINQTTFSTGLGAGTHVLDVITLTVGTYASDVAPEIVLTPGLFGESLGLEGGACPGNVAGCVVSVSSANIVPEPSTAVCLGLGLLGLRLARRRIGLDESPLGVS